MVSHSTILVNVSPEFLNIHPQFSDTILIRIMTGLHYFHFRIQALFVEILFTFLSEFTEHKNNKNWLKSSYTPLRKLQTTSSQQNNQTSFRDFFINSCSYCSYNSLIQLGSTLLKYGGPAKSSTWPSLLVWELTSNVRLVDWTGGNFEFHARNYEFDIYYYSIRSLNEFWEKATLLLPKFLCFEDSCMDKRKVDFQ